MSDPTPPPDADLPAARARDLRDGAGRLLAALDAAPPDRRTCNRIRAAFPDMAEAELRGERIVQLFPAETAHLDACESCALEYGEVLDALLTLEKAVGGEPDAPPPTLPAHMLTALRIRRWVEATAERVLQKTLQNYGDVETQLASWLEEMATAPLSMTPSQQQMALGYGGENTEMPLIQATWFAAQALAERYTVDDLRALQARGALAAPVREAAEQIARHLPKRQRSPFVDAFVSQALENPAAMIELGRAA